MTDTLRRLRLCKLVERENYRQTYDEQFVADTAMDMQANGFKIEFPIVVYREGNQYVIIDGHTRYRAACLASTYHVKTHRARLLVWVVVKDKPSDAQFKLMQLEANEKRRNPDPVSQAIGYQQALDAGATLEQIAESTGRSLETIKGRLSLLKLVPEVQQMVATGQFPVGHAEVMTQLDSNRQRSVLRIYNAGKAVTFSQFSGIVADYYNDQIAEGQTSLFDLENFWVKQVQQQAELPKRGKHAVTGAPVRADIPQVRTAGARDTINAIIDRYIADLVAAGFQAEAGAIGNLYTALVHSNWMAVPDHALLLNPVPNSTMSGG